MSENRQTLIIEKEFQYSFIKSTLLIVFAALVMFLGSQIMFFSKMISYGRTAGLEDGHVYYEFLSDQQFQMTAIGVLFFSILTALTLLWALKFSNRIAGPLYRLKLNLSRRLNGEDVTIEFREGDHFRELAELVERNLRK